MTGSNWYKLVTFFHDGEDSLWAEFILECETTIVDSLATSQWTIKSSPTLKLSEFVSAMSLAEFAAKSVEWLSTIFRNLENDDSFDLMQDLVSLGFDGVVSQNDDIELVAEGYYWDLYFSVCCSLSVAPETVAVRDFCLPTKSNL